METVVRKLFQKVKKLVLKLRLLVTEHHCHLNAYSGALPNTFVFCWDAVN